MMYIPHLKKNHRNIPILSKNNINAISERYVVEFMPEVLKHPQPLDIERFIESYLDLRLDFQYLSHDGRYLGMTVFNNTDKVVIYLPEVKQADYLHADQGTIIVDNSLLEINQEHCYRYTLGHESGHWVFHKAHFDYDPNQMTLFEMNSPYLQCRSINQNYLNEKKGGWDEARWMEWQADKFSAGILMPETAVRYLLKEGYFCENFLSDSDEYSAICLTSDIFNVSKQAAYFRLCDLGYIRQLVNDSKYKQLSLF